MARKQRRQAPSGPGSETIGIPLAPRPVQSLLARRESDVYRLLLVAPGLTAADIAARTSNPVNATRVSLARLAAHGLVQVTGKRPLSYVANPPSVAFGGHLHQLEATLDEHRRQIAGLDDLYAIGRSEHVHRLMEVVTGKESIARRFVHLESAVCNEVLAFDRPPYVMQPGDPRQEGAELGLLARGVTVRCVYDRRCLESGQALELMIALAEAGEQSRLASGLPVKLAIFDRATAVLPLGPGSGDDQVMIIRRSSLLTILIEYFDRVWNEAAPLLVPAASCDASDRASAADRNDGDTAASVQPDDEPMLALLAAGVADAAIARQLGVSERTVGRRVRRLMDELGALSRFQLGAQVALAGRLAPAEHEPATLNGNRRYGE